ncbi:MAG TPA: hypothetical protein ENG35_05505 [Desulfobacteraceae bacterium]|nr:hypothetical protein [Desulfobacteraceae bacterium]
MSATCRLERRLESLLPMQSCCVGRMEVCVSSCRQPLHLVMGAHKRRVWRGIKYPKLTC